MELSLVLSLLFIYFFVLRILSFVMSDDFICLFVI